MTVTQIVQANNQAEDGALAATALLRTKHPATAILCGNDLTAIGALGAATHLGVSVPDELSIIGSDDIAMASYSHPPLSTVRIPRDVMGYEAFRLLESMGGPGLRRGTEACVATSFTQRGSSGRHAQRAQLEPTSVVLRVVKGPVGASDRSSVR